MWSRSAAKVKKLPDIGCQLFVYINRLDGIQDAITRLLNHLTYKSTCLPGPGAEIFRAMAAKEEPCLLQWRRSVKLAITRLNLLSKARQHHLMSLLHLLRILILLITSFLYKSCKMIISCFMQNLYKNFSNGNIRKIFAMRMTTLQ
ncbi:hypothetical protein TVAG_248030 [Trichomonas vaginalis G3]|uniref:Uncharacterized protein n=1 Tax=Trichomonas vaginalis (strain ATCC PRA-98 / G3) TaxID=412133 RepID=A2FRF8_TRIV3|nr:dipeptidyl-peptidase protein [Trichomonas vaginalis G3]EAX92522.1 hypothetical protein TVAG_248030 [Trichomonas vaginalis G3]KAI5540789.1 dipeptidyl-peptidase protein [Trichomonas vaginalis G3]|eukprot:XP_001305452.1 hypothetical protein [Trichomonas vaginalis G3]